MQDFYLKNRDADTIHLVFDFSEKLLFPRLLRQPGLLYFVNGLKFDFFGVSISNFNYTDIHCLPKGHWPGGKTADEVSYMLYHSINISNHLSTF